jgi:hypothetical protein
MLRRLRIGLKSGTSEMFNEYRTRLHVNASEYVHVMISAMWDSITRIKSIHHSPEGLPVARDGFRKRGKRENVKEQIARFQLIRKAIPPHDGKKVCFQNLTPRVVRAAPIHVPKMGSATLSRRSRIYLRAPL